MISGLVNSSRELAMSAVCAIAGTKPFSQRFAGRLHLCSLMLTALSTSTLARAADVVSAAADPLAQPTSMHQVGLPVAATHAASPTDNPQTPEKGALGQRPMFDARLTAAGTIA